MGGSAYPLRQVLPGEALSTGGGAMKARHLGDLQKSLKPCAHCGGPATLRPMRNAPLWFQVRCNDYDCGMASWAKIGVDAAVEASNWSAAGYARSPHERVAVHVLSDTTDGR